MTIALLTGDNGILTQSNKAKENTEIASEKEQIELAYLSVVSNKKDTHVEADELFQELNKIGVEVESVVGNKNLVVILNNKRIYEIAQDGKFKYVGIQQNITDAEPIMMARKDDYAFWQEEYRTKITKIYTKPYITEIDSVQEWDISKNQDNSDIAYIIDDKHSGYELYIVANGRIKLNENSANLFARFSNVEQIDLSSVDTTNVTRMENMFLLCEKMEEIDLSSFETPNLIGIYRMFQSCKSLKSLNLNNFDTSQVSNFTAIFQGCESLENLEIENFDTSKATSMLDMFSGCKKLKNIDVSNFDTSKVTNMQSMFSNCSSLENLNILNFNTSNVTNMNYMFSSCISLKELDVSNFDTSKVTSIEQIFYHCDMLTKLNLSNWDLKNVTSKTHAFIYLNKEINIITNEETANWIVNYFTDLQIINNENDLYIVGHK